MIFYAKTFTKASFLSGFLLKSNEIEQQVRKIATLKGKKRGMHQIFVKVKLKKLDRFLWFLPNMNDIFTQKSSQRKDFYADFCSNPMKLSKRWGRLPLKGPKTRDASDLSESKTERQADISFLPWRKSLPRGQVGSFMANAWRFLRKNEVVKVTLF